MAIVLPHIFKDGVGETASGAQVMENFNVLKEAIEAVQAGAWTSWETLSNKVEEIATFYTVRVRLELGASARLRGVLKVKATAEVKTGETVLVLPAAFRPTKPIGLPVTYGAGLMMRLEITAAGVVTLSPNAVKELENLYLDGLTWSVA